MRRVSSRQRLHSDEAFSANALSHDSLLSDDEEPEQYLCSADGKDGKLRASSLEYPATRKRIRGPSASVVQLLEVNGNSSKPATRPTTTSTTSASTSTPPPQRSLLQALPDDLLLNAFAFLPYQELRALLCSSTALHKLLKSEAADWLWYSLMSYKWGSSFFSPNKRIKYCRKAHLSRILQQASPWCPTQLDSLSLQRPKVLVLRSRRVAPPPTTVNFEMLSETSVQFHGTVGTGDRCVRSNQPLARPLHMGKKSKKGSSLGLSKSLFHNFFCRSSSAAVVAMSSTSLSSSSSSRHFYHRQNSKHHHHQQQHNMEPFVCPFMSQSGTTVLVPRLVSYFEAKILPRTISSSSSGSSSLRPTTTEHHHNNHNHGNLPNDCVAIGLSTKSFSTFGRMPGWDDQSWGLHGDDGGLFHGCGDMLKRFSRSFGAGDVVGCGVDYLQRGIFFTLNGAFLGFGFRDLTSLEKQQELYPTVGIDTNCVVEVNFGQTPFAFRLEGYRHDTN